VQTVPVEIYALFGSHAPAAAYVILQRQVPIFTVQRSVMINHKSTETTTGMWCDHSSHIAHGLEYGWHGSYFSSPNLGRICLEFATGDASCSIFGSHFLFLASTSVGISLAIHSCLLGGGPGWTGFRRGMQSFRNVTFSESSFTIGYDHSEQLEIEPNAIICRCGRKRAYIQRSCQSW
jgi:hypothetical protein